MPRRERHANAARLGPKLFQRHTAGSELLAVSRIDLALPEMLTQAQPHGKVEYEIGIGSRFARRWHHGAAELDQRLCFGIDLKADLQGFALEAGRNGQDNVSQRCGWRHEEIGMGVEFQGGQGGASAQGIGLGKQQIGAKADEPAYR